MRLVALTFIALVGAIANVTPVVAQEGGVLFWPPQQRETAFRAMEHESPHAIIPASSTPRPLPTGDALNIDVDAFMEAERVAGVLVLQDGQIRFERYGLDLRPQDHWISFSMTKSVTSTLVGAALREGRIKSLNDPVVRYVPSLVGEGYSGVTLDQLMTMTSGVRWSEDYEDPQSDVARFLVTEADPGIDSTVSYMRRLPRESPPGSKWHYNTGETNLVGVVLAEAVGMSLSRYLAETLWAAPGGMESPAYWMLDAQGKEVGGCCLSATLRDWGRFGLLNLEEGALGDGSIVPDGWLKASTTRMVDIGVPGRGYGRLWWTFDPGHFQARGIFGQTVHIDPSRRLVVVILSAWPTATGRERSAARDDMIFALSQAVDRSPPTVR